jgi:uncharacterized membrane protein
MSRKSNTGRAIMKKHIKWLFKEIDKWVNEGIIGTDQGEVLKNRYPAAEGTAWGRIIFFSIGAILFGLGVILLFAYNWERMHKFAKLVLIFFALLAAHGAGFWLRQPESKYKTAGEGLHLLGTMLFGAGIWLIAQIYHIEEHYPNALLIWGLGALGLAWALPSISQGVVATILLVMWNSFEAFDFKDPHLLSPFLILGAILPLAWLNRSRVLVTTVICAFLVSLAFSVAKIEGDLVPLVLFFSACMLIAMNLIVRFIGFLIYLAILFVLSFHHRGRGMWLIHFDQFQESLYFFSFALAAIGFWAWAIWTFRQKKVSASGEFRIEYYGVLVTLIVILLNALGVLVLRGWIGVAVFNIFFLFHSIMMIVSGCKFLDLKSTSTGCLLFTILAMTRYTDLFVSLLTRSLVFFITGAALFAVGIYYSKTKKQMQEKTT